MEKNRDVKKADLDFAAAAAAANEAEQRRVENRRFGQNQGTHPNQAFPQMQFMNPPYMNPPYPGMNQPLPGSHYSNMQSNLPYQFDYSGYGHTNQPYQSGFHQPGYGRNWFTSSPFYLDQSSLPPYLPAKVTADIKTHNMSHRLCFLRNRCRQQQKYHHGRRQFRSEHH